MIPHDQRRFECISARLAELEIADSKAIEKVYFSECDGYARHGDIPTDFKPYQGPVWGGKADAHAWFKFAVRYPQLKDGQEALLQVSTGIGGWDACNPQMLLFYDGVAVRGVDVNHTKFLLPKNVKEVVAYAYPGTNVTKPLSFDAFFTMAFSRAGVGKSIAANCSNRSLQ